MIVRCAGVSDVIESVRFARTHDLLVAVRGGGHSVAGKAVCDDGILIDLSPMKGVRVDPVRRVAHAQAGLTLRELDQETAAFGLATSLGVVSMTGIAGLTLGGGFGWLNGKYGLAVDNLLSVDLVMAEGRFLTANATEHDDLFWALRGGGGNFGIATSFEYRLHPVDNVVAGLIIHPLPRAREVLHFYREFSASAPDDLNVDALMATGPDGNPMIALVTCYSGPLDRAEGALKPLRSFGPPVADLVRPMRFVEVQRMLDHAFPEGFRHYWKAHFVRTLNEAAIDTLVSFAESKASPTTSIVLQQFHGAAARVAPSATAFAHRHQQYNLIIVSMWTDHAEADRNIRWTRDLSETMGAFTEQDVYVNDLGEEGEERVMAAYGLNYERLSALKKKYDPTNFFRLNHNIKPAA
jgi:FAD/FMN-containing dehydrogenase